MEGRILAGCSILLVESDFIIAKDVEQRLQAAGATVLAASRLEHALRLAEHPDLAAGVLDFELARGDTTPVCWRLIDRRVPFVFHSATPFAEFRQWPKAPVLIRPKVHRLVATVAGLFR